MYLTCVYEHVEGSIVVQTLCVGLIGYCSSLKKILEYFSKVCTFIIHILEQMKTSFTFV